MGRKRATRRGRRSGILHPRAAGWVVMGALVAGGVAAVGMVDDDAATGASATSADIAAMRNREEEAARSSRGDTRTAPPPTPSPAAPTPRATKAPKPKKPARIVPIGGLSQRQMNHAITIVREAERRKMPERAMVVALSTALQESYLRNLANPAVPESENLPNDGDGADHDSLGLFQQRPSSGWGSVEDLMDPAYAAGRFLDALAKVSGWESMSITEAAQTVQVSAYPGAYAQHESFARKLVAAIRHPG